MVYRIFDGLIDLPIPRNCEAAFPSATQDILALSACTCSRARVSPVLRIDGIESKLVLAPSPEWNLDQRFNSFTLQYLRAVGWLSRSSGDVP